MTGRFDEGLEEKLEALVQEIYDLEKWLNHNDDDKQDLLWVQLYAMQSYAAALKARIRARSDK